MAGAIFLLWYEAFNHFPYGRSRQRWKQACEGEHRKARIPMAPVRGIYPLQGP